MKNKIFRWKIGRIFGKIGCVIAKENETFQNEMKLKLQNEISEMERINLKRKDLQASGAGGGREKRNFLRQSTKEMPAHNYKIGRDSICAEIY